MRFNGLHVGQAVTTSGYCGTVARLCEWSDMMVEVRLASGVVCVDAGDVTPRVNEPHTLVGCGCARCRDERTTAATGGR